MLTGSNSYTGGTTINLGTLSLSGFGSLFSTGAVSVNSATSAFDISALGSGTTIGDLSGVAGSSVLLGSKTLTVGTSTPSVTFQGIISGSGGAIVKQGSGTWVLSGTNTYNGGTTISLGTLSISSDANLGNASGGVALEGGELEATSTFSSSRNLTTSSVFSRIGVTSGQTLTLTSPIADGSLAGSIIKTGLGSLIFSAANSYSEGTTINGGTLTLIGSGSLSSTGSVSVNGSSSIFDLSGIAAGAMTIGDLSGIGSGNVNLGSKILTVGTSTPFTLFAGDIAGSGAIIKQDNGTWIISGINSYTGGTTISGGR